MDKTYITYITFFCKGLRHKSLAFYTSHREAYHDFILIDCATGGYPACDRFSAWHPAMYIAVRSVSDFRGQEKVWMGLQGWE